MPEAGGLVSYAIWTAALAAFRANKVSKEQSAADYGGLWFQRIANKPFAPVSTA
jgi:hypothetical protein